MKVKLDDLDLTSLKDFVGKINTGFQNLDTSIIRNTLAITKFGDYWQFLKILSGDAPSITDPLFVKLWTSNFEVTQHLKQWLGFVESVYDRLTQYDVQKDPSKCIEDLDFSETISPEKFSKFLESIQKYGVADNLNGIAPNELELKALNEALDFTLKSKVDSSCETDRLVIKGAFVKISDLNKTNCKTDNFVQIFSLSKMFIDEDLNKIGNKTKLAIVAPSLEIIGDRTINLSGKDAVPLNQWTKPGNPGGSSGSFLAVSIELVDKLGNLTVLSNGGNGGAGNPGEEGTKGRSPSTNVDYYYKNSKCSTVCNSLENPSRAYDGYSYFRCIYRDCGTSDSYRCWRIYGSQGGNGQSGGKGGFGGNKGSINLLLENDTRVKISNENGKPGRNGAGGLGGLKGDNILIVCKAARGFYLEDLVN